MQCLQDPNESNIDNIISVRHEASRHSRKKKKEYLKAKIDELETNSKMKNIAHLYRGISDFKKGYHPRDNIDRIRRVIWLTTPTVLWLGEGNISLGC